MLITLGLLVQGCAVPVTRVAAVTATGATARQVGTFNMAGGHGTYGALGDQAPDALVTSVQERGPAFVTLQETCRDWTERLDARLPGYSVRFDPVQTGGGATARCRHASDFGNAVLYRDDLGIDAATAHPLESPAGYEQREMLCVRSTAASLAICSAHLTNGDDQPQLDARRHEASVAAGILAGQYAGYTVFLGGDLNDDPMSGMADNFYDSGYGRGARGRFKEVDSPCGNTITERTGSWPLYTYCRDGEATFDDWVTEEGSPTGQKFDFIFVTRALQVDWGDATTAPYSDHDPLWASVRF
ncbi:endonuclease/exonuclease/phosphatase family protein [Sphaerisporangium rufum]|uniref:endonuclease/exonuclease/phosphatase family protein n=1 Tax=Sphaerisporangium rufum TaxID=1381558 RepID=UPI00194DEB82|nr:endonuclease/exonuclease/phosphatase family protein [Sphaerisporangium rufum]